MKIVPTAAVVATVALLTGGCGSGSPTSTTSSTSSFQSLVSGAYAYAHCMREHGVPGFPDPKVINSAGHQGIGVRAITSANDPKAKAALRACQGILPTPSKADLAAQAAQRRAHTQDLLSFARCMRGRGVNGFPDPNAQGDLTTDMITAAGVDLHAPHTAAAARACIPAAHGILTRAMVAQATGGSG